MKISKAEEQSLRIMARLAKEGGQLTLADLSLMEHLPDATIAKLLGRLRRGGLVVALRGRNGGYTLVRPAHEISAADVIRALGRPVLEGSSCTSDRPNDPDCPHVGNCGLRSVWKHLAQQVGEVLETMTLDDLCCTEEEVEAQLTGLDDMPLRAVEGTERS